MIYANLTRHLQRKHPKSYMEWRRHSNLLQIQDIPSNVKLVGRGRKKSSIWLFFNNVDNMAVCKLCGHSMKQNMPRHLYNKHLKAYNKWQNIRIRNNEYSWADAVTRAKLLRMRRGWLKQYIRRIDINSFRCELCHKILKMCDGDYSNIRRHIRSQHPYIYDREMKAYRDVTKQKPEPVENKDKVIEYVVEYIDTNDPLLESDTIVNLITSDDNELNNTDVNLTSYLSDKVDENEKSDKSKGTNDSDDAKHLEINDTLSDDDPLIEDKIKWLCRKNVEGKRQTLTCFWNFFNVLVVNKLYQCLFCARKVAIYPQSIGNLKRHIAGKHAWQYNLILKYAPKYDSCKNSKPKYVKRSQPVVKESVSSTASFDILDEGCFKCKKCGKVIVCGEDQKILFDHVKEEHDELKTDTRTDSELTED